MLKHPNYFHFRQVPILKSALLFFHKHLFTILAITFEPFELFRCVTTHLKAKNPLYKDHAGFFTGQFWKMVYVPRSVVNFLGLTDNEKVSKYFYQGLVVKNIIPLVTIAQVFV